MDLPPDRPMRRRYQARLRSEKAVPGTDPQAVATIATHAVAVALG
jgi:hypothetical protein